MDIDPIERASRPLPAWIWCVVGNISLIGKLSEYQDEITTAQVKQKVFDEWGERTSILKGLRRLWRRRTSTSSA